MGNEREFESSSVSAAAAQGEPKKPTPEKSVVVPTSDETPPPSVDNTDTSGDTATQQFSGGDDPIAPTAPTAALPAPQPRAPASQAPASPSGNKDMVATKPPGFFARTRSKLAASLDRRPDRWEISDKNQIRVEEGNVIITELAISGLAGAVKHSFKIAKIANFYFEPLLSDDQKGKADMFVWERTNNPGKLRQVYVGTVDVRSGLIPHVEALQDRLGIG